MKATAFFAVTAIFAAFSPLRAEEIDIPLLYKSPAAAGKTAVQPQAFGFYENQERIVLAFRIENLSGIMKKPKAYLSFYADTDNDPVTGRFPKVYGWDFQINVQLYRNTLKAMKWNGNQAESLNLKGKYVISASKDTLFVSIRREALSSVNFSRKFQFKVNVSAEELSGTLKENQPVDTGKPVGVFPEKFKTP